ncbi:MAG: wax ester/triacylglycerol synthase domain-containing protein [Acidimicrobiales bacterium]
MPALASEAPDHMSGPEALMWGVERDPVLRSSFVNVSVLDGEPDLDRFRLRMSELVEALPRLRHRVEPSWVPGVLPRWVEDPQFDIDHHVLKRDLASPASDRSLLDLAAVHAQEPFDPTRALWQMTVVNALSEGRAALLVKMHHAVTDGVGGVRLSAGFLDLDRQGTPIARSGLHRPLGTGSRAAQSGIDHPSSIVARVATTAEALSGLAPRALSGVMHPREMGHSAWRVLEGVNSLAHQMNVLSPAQSPLWGTTRSTDRHFEIMSISLARAKQAARALEGTVNDVFVTGVAGGAGSYHRLMGSAVDALRVSVPVSTRTDHSAGGNAFIPTRVLVPTGDGAVVDRFHLTHDRLAQVKASRALGVASAAAGVFTGLPGPILTRLARQQVRTVDFAASNVRGAPVELYLAGAKVLANYPMGPTAGTAFNATVLSYGPQLDIGLNIDTAAVTEPGRLASCIAEALEEVLVQGD